MIGVAEIKKMSRTERLRAMELLWESFEWQDEEIDAPAWHHELVKERIAKIERGEETFLTFDQFKRRLKRKRK